MNKKLAELENITIIKRSGKEEKWSRNKMMRAVLWACDNNVSYAKILLDSTIVKLENKMNIADVFDSVIDTAASKISRIQPKWEFVASKLHLLKMYSESVHFIKNKQYPHLKHVLKLGIQEGIYNKSTYLKYSEDEINTLNDSLLPEEDYSFSYSSLLTFDGKYCKRLKSGVRLELPQYTYMRVAMGICWNLGKEFDSRLSLSRVEIVKAFYKILTKGEATVATPIMNNSFTNLTNYASCILSTIGNNTFDLMNALQTAGQYTKGGGGVAYDISLVQAIGSKTKNGVTAGGIVPFIRNIQSVIQSMLQNEKRRGASVVTCAWWHYEIMTFLELKDASSGTEENRALHLKYSLATNNFLYDAVQNKEDIYLFDPVDTPLLNTTHGEEWVKNYKEYVKDESIRRRTVNSRSDLFKKFLKYSFQTGNIYEINLDEVNRRTMTNRYIGSSNLCSEILEPSRPSAPVEEFTVEIDKKPMTVNSSVGGEIAICNLASFNMNILDYPKKKMDDIIYIVSLIMNNTIDIGSYMRSAGEYSNKKYRYLGLGQNNWAAHLAKHKIKMNSKEAQDFTYLAYQKLSNSIVMANTILAEQLGRNPNMKGTKWDKGELTYDSSNEFLKRRFEHLHDKEAESLLKDRVKKFGVVNILMMATAPTASSANAKGLTESIEPLHALSYNVNGTVSTNVLAPDIASLGNYYSLAYEVTPENIIIQNCIRQMWIDQSQSCNIYLKEEDWSYSRFLKLKLLGKKLGMKTWYYTNTPKGDIGEQCDSCG